METKICKGCNRELSVEQFPFVGTHGGGKRRVGYCKDCMAAKRSQGQYNRRDKKNENMLKQLEDAKKARLADFTPRELMTELVNRGYTGQLKYVKVETIDLANF